MYPIVALGKGKHFASIDQLFVKASSSLNRPESRPRRHQSLFSNLVNISTGITGMDHPDIVQSHIKAHMVTFEIDTLFPLTLTGVISIFSTNDGEAVRVSMMGEK